MPSKLESDREIVSDYELFTRFNAYYIKTRIALIESDIEDMYERNTPSLCSDNVTGLIYYESYSVENLAIAIIEEREKLAKYISKADRDLQAFYTVLNQFEAQERREIKKYIRKRSTPYMSLIERFKIALNDYINSSRCERNKHLLSKNYYLESKRPKTNNYPHKLTLNQEKAIREKAASEKEKNISIEAFTEKVNMLDETSFKDFIYKRNENNITFEQVLTLLNIIPKKLSKSESAKPYNYIRNVGLNTN